MRCVISFSCKSKFESSYVMIKY